MSRSLGVRDFCLMFKLERLIVPFSSFILGFILAAGTDYFSLLLGFLVLVFIYASAATLNDIFDLKIDVVSNPERPLPSRKMEMSGAWAIFIVLGAIGLLTAFFLSLKHLSDFYFYFMVGELILGILYALLFSKNFLSANFLLGFSHGVIPFVGALALFSGDSYPIPLFFAGALFVTLFLNYNLKDLKDVDGDRLQRSTLPSIFGIRQSKKIFGYFLFAPFIFSLTSIYFRPLTVGFTVNMVVSILFLVLINKHLSNAHSKEGYTTSLGLFRILASLWIITLGL